MGTGFYKYLDREDVKLVFDRLRNCCFSAAGLAIHGTASHLQTSRAVHYSIAGQTFYKATISDIDPADAGTIADGYTNILLVQLDSSGDYSFKLGTAVASGSTPAIPSPDSNVAAISAAQVKNDSGSTFTFGTTDFDAGGVTSTYYDLGMVVPTETLTDLS